MAMMTGLAPGMVSLRLAGEFLHHVRGRGDGDRVGVHQFGHGQLHGAFAGAHLADDDAGMLRFEHPAGRGDDVLLRREQACLFAAGQRLFGHEGAEDLPLLGRGAGVQGRVAVLHDLMQQRAVPLQQVAQLVGLAEHPVAALAVDAVDPGGEALGPGLAAAGVLVDDLAVFVLGDDLLAGRTAHEHIAQVDGLELAGGDQGADVAGAQANDGLEVDGGRLAQPLPVGGERCAFLVDDVGGFLVGQLRAAEHHLGLRQRRRRHQVDVGLAVVAVGFVVVEERWPCCLPLHQLLGAGVVVDNALTAVGEQHALLILLVFAVGQGVDTDVVEVAGDGAGDAFGAEDLVLQHENQEAVRLQLLHGLTQEVVFEAVLPLLVPSLPSSFSRLTASQS